MEMLHRYDKKLDVDSAGIIVTSILSVIHAESVVDVGCGDGAWLAIYKENGIKDVLGIDEICIPQGSFKTDGASFVPADLKRVKKIQPGRKFDLVNCVDTAAYLPESSAADFVEFLVSLGDVIVFSSAMPGEPGRGIVNQQFPDYWEKQFNKKGFVFLDIFRKKNWNNESIAWQYRQNMFLAVRSDSDSSLLARLERFDGNSYVHPELLKFYKMILEDEMHRDISGKQALKALMKAVVRSFSSKFAKAIFLLNEVRQKLRFHAYGLARYDDIPTHLTHDEKLLLFCESAKKKGIFVEIGSYVGASTCCIGQGLKNKHEAVLYCIDTWENHAMTEGTRDTYSEFKRNTSDFKDRIVGLKGFSSAQIDYFKSKSLKIDFLFIDGDHSYDGVLADWGGYSPFLNEGAVVVFHDYGAFPGVKKVVDENVRRNAVWEKILPNMYCCRIK